MSLLAPGDELVDNEHLNSAGVIRCSPSKTIRSASGERRPMTRANRLMKLGILTMAMAILCPATSWAEAEEESPKVTDQSLPAIDAYIAKKKIDKTASDWKGKLPKPPRLRFPKGSSYFWHLDTNKGNIKIKLFHDTAPLHTASTMYLTRLGFYDDIVFHRVIPGFMAQGGDPTGTGGGGPGYLYSGEFDSDRKHSKPGILSMANRGPNTDGSQFFLTFVKTPHLDGNHTVFGEVVEGMGTVRSIERKGTRSGKTTQKLFIKKATISVE